MKEPAEVIEEALIPSLIKNKEFLIQNRNATEQFNLELQKLKFPDELAKIQAESINFDTFKTDAKKLAAKATFDTINGFGDKFGEMLDGTIENFKEKRVEVQKDISSYLEKGYSFDPTRTEDFRIISKDYIGAIETTSNKHIDDLKVLAAEDVRQNTVNRAKVEDALIQMGIKDKKLDALITQLEAGAVVQINVEMNSNKVADTMFQIHKRKGHFAVAAANPS